MIKLIQVVFLIFNILKMGVAKSFLPFWIISKNEGYGLFFKFSPDNYLSPVSTRNISRFSYPKKLWISVVLKTGFLNVISNYFFSFKWKFLSRKNVERLKMRCFLFFSIKNGVFNWKKSTNTFINLKFS